MPHYAVRITHSYDVCKRLVAQWALKSQALAVYEHLGEKTGKVHIHLALYSTSVDKKQLRNIAASCGVNVKGNENCSFKEWDGKDLYIIYMTKGSLDPKYLLNYSQDDSDVWKAQWVAPKEYIKETCWMKLYAEFAPTCVITPFDGPEWVDSKATYSPRELHSQRNFPIIYAAAFRFVKSKLHVHCPQYKSFMDCCVRTHCWNHHVTIPKDYKV